MAVKKKRASKKKSASPASSSTSADQQSPTPRGSSNKVSIATMLTTLTSSFNGLTSVMSLMESRLKEPDEVVSLHTEKTPKDVMEIEILQRLGLAKLPTPRELATGAYHKEPLCWFLLFADWNVKVAHLFTELRTPGEVVLAMRATLEKSYKISCGVSHELTCIMEAFTFLAQAYIGLQANTTPSDFFNQHDRVISDTRDHFTELEGRRIEAAQGEQAGKSFRAVRGLIASSFPAGCEDALKAVRTRLSGKGTAPGDGPRRVADRPPRGGGGGGGGRPPKRDRPTPKCRRCHQEVQGPFADHNKKGVCPKVK